MPKPLKPKVLGDVFVRTTITCAFDKIPERLNLRTTATKVVRLPLTRIFRWVAFAGAAVYFIFGSVSAPTLFTQASSGNATSTAASSADTSAERAALEAQLTQLNAQIDQYQGQIVSYQKQGKSLSGEISQLNAKIAKLNLQIQATNLTIQQIDDQISNTQTQIAVTQGDIVAKKAAIIGLMQHLYKQDDVSLVQMFLRSERLSDFWSDAEDVALLQNNLRLEVQQIGDLQGQLQDQEQQFEASKADAQSAAEYQKAQASEISSTKSEKAQLLSATKGQESKYQALLKQTQATAAQIRNRIFQLLGGGQLSFGAAYQYAKMASDATGIDPSFILSILDRESALGSNVGQCSYKTAMSPSNQPIYLQITAALNINPDTMKVSCANADGAYGGAMGPAQFVPSTWELYADSVSKITGNNPPSPWNNADAFVATALYLKDAMVGCKSVYGSLISQERCTAAKYYAGSRWQNYLWTYGEAVVDRAQSFASDIKTLNAGS